MASIRRIVRTPKRWDRIVELADGLGTKLPEEPDSKALNDFLLAQKQKDPDHFPDLSLAVVKLMGPGEYVLVKPNEESPGHFGLAVQDYTHSTAPNRRFPDVVTQRIMKAHLAKAQQPYSEGDLNAIAQRCTLMEDAARKVEREMQKRIAAVVLHPRIGQTFQAIVTGVNQHGTFVRALDPHVEGMLVNGGKPGAKGWMSATSYGEAGLHRSAAGVYRFRNVASGSARLLVRLRSRGQKRLRREIASRRLHGQRCSPARRSTGKRSTRSPREYRRRCWCSAACPGCRSRADIPPASVEWCGGR